MEPMKRNEKTYAALDPQNPVRRSIVRGAETEPEARRETAQPLPGLRLNTTFSKAGLRDFQSLAGHQHRT
jgi:hypothetical protein